MSNEEELIEENARLKQELERLKLEKDGLGQAMTKKSAEVAGERSEMGVFGKKIQKVGMENGFDKEEVSVVVSFSKQGHRFEKDKVWCCMECDTVLTDIEKIESNNNVYCEKCYRQNIHDLDKDDYKILLCIANGHTDTSTFLEAFGFIATLQRLTGLTKQKVTKKMWKLKDLGYVFHHGIIFSQLRVSSKGEEALAAYEQVYRDRDMDDVRFRIATARTPV